MLPLKKTKQHGYKAEVQQELAYALADREFLKYWHVPLQICLLGLMMPEKFTQ